MTNEESTITMQATRQGTGQSGAAQSDAVSGAHEKTLTQTPPSNGPAAAKTTEPVRLRDDGITLVAIYHFLLSGLFLLGTIGLAIPTVITGIVGVVEDPGALVATAILGVIATVTMLICLLLLAVGYGLWTQRQWARVAAIALAILGLFAFPIGTLLGGFILWYLIKPDVADRFR